MNPNIHLVVEHMYVVQSVYYYQQTFCSDYLLIVFKKNVN